MAKPSRFSDAAHSHAICRNGCKKNARRPFGAVFEAFLPQTPRPERTLLSMPCNMRRARNAASVNGRCATITFAESSMLARGDITSGF